MIDTRKQQIQDLAHIYTNRYVCAIMGDYNLDTEDRLCAEANNWMLAQKAANNITNDELQEAIWTLEKKAQAEGQAFAYDKIVVMQ